MSLLLGFFAPVEFRRGLETLFLMADERLCHISSTLVREIGRFKTRLHDFVPAEIEDQIFQRLSRWLRLICR